MPQSVRTLAAVALGALLVAASAVTALSVRPAATVAATDPTGQPAAHTITISASGTVSVVPDIVRVSLGISTSKPTVAAARSQAARIMTAIIARAKALGVDEKDIQTTNVNLYPQYAPNSQARIVGYTMSEQVRITVRDMDKAGAVVDGATAAGANTVDGISFDVADPSKAQNDARVAAVESARVRAEAMARAAHVTLGSVTTIVDSSVSTPVPYPMSYDRLSAAGVATPIQAGTQDVVAQVSVVFELE